MKLACNGSRSTPGSDAWAEPRRIRTIGPLVCRIARRRQSKVSEVSDAPLSTSPTQSEGVPRARRSTRWRRLRWVAAATLAIVALYALLPVWLPVGWLRSKAADALSRGLGCPVRAGSIDVSWSAGVVLRDWAVLDPESPGSTLLELGAIHCPLAPLATILAGGIDRIDVDSPRISARIDAQGRVNLGRIRPAESGRIPVRQLRISGTRLDVVDERSGKRDLVEIATCELTIDPRSARAGIRIDGRLISPLAIASASPGRDGNAFRTTADLSVPTLAKDDVGRGARAAGESDPSLQGSGEFSWRDVDLASLPLHWLPNLRDAKVAGRCSGRIAASVGGALDQVIELETTVADLRVETPGRGDVVQVPSAAIAAAGRWRPAYDVLEFSRLHFETPDLDLVGCATVPPGTPAPPPGAPVLVWSLAGDTQLRVGLEGRVRDAARLHDWLPTRWCERVFGSVGSGANPSGELELEVSAIRTVRDVRASVSLRSPNLACPGGTVLRLDGRVPVEISAAATWSDAEHVVQVDPLSISLGDARLSLTAAVPLPTEVSDDVAASKWLQSVWRAGRARIAIDIPDTSAFVARLPAIRRAANNWRIAGPLFLGAEMRSTSSGTAFEIAAHGGESFVCVVPGVLNKGVGRPLSLNASTTYAREPDGIFQDVEARIAYGNAEFSTRPDGAPNRIRVAVRRSDERDDAASSPPAQSKDDKLYTIDLSAELAARLQNIEGVPSLVPGLERAIRALDAPGTPAAECTRIAGELDVDLNANLRHISSGHAMWPELWRVSIGLFGDRLDMRVGSAFQSPCGSRVRGQVDYWFDRRRPRDVHRLLGRVELAGGKGEFEASLGGGYQTMEGRAAIEDVRVLSAQIPPLRSATDRLSLSGGGEAAIRWSWAPESEERVISVDLTPLSFSATTSGAPSDSESLRVAKSAGLPLRAKVLLRTEREGSTPAGPRGTGDARGRMVRWAVDDLEAQVGSCRLYAPRGYVTLDEASRAALERAAQTGDWQTLLASAPRWQTELETSVQGVADAALRSLSPELAGALDHYGLVGETHGTLHVSGTPESFRVRGSADATQLTIRLPALLTKNAGLAAALRWDAQIAAPFVPSATAPAPTVHVNDASLTFAGASVGLRADVQLAVQGYRSAQSSPDTLAGRVERADVQGNFDSGDLAHFPERFDRLLPPIRMLAQPKAGRVRGTFALRAEHGRLRAADAQLQFAHAAFETEGPDTQPLPIVLNGDVSLSSGELRCRALDLRIGDTDVTVSGTLSHVRGASTGSMTVSGRRLDVPQLQAWLSRVAPPDAAANDDGNVRRLLRALEPADLRVTAFCASGIFPGLDGGAPFPVDELNVDAVIRAGVLETSFVCAANAGWIKGEIRLPLTEADPGFDLSYEARELLPAPNTRPIIEGFFPGMIVNGRITLIDRSHQKLIDAPGRDNYPTGTGEMILGRGVIEGRAAPVWVTRIFPGLNMSRFEFTEMRNRFEKLADGRHNNHMTFFGRYYHVYVDGYTLADGKIRYEVGVDLLARIDPDLSRIGQGRVAIFIKTGRIRQGRLEDEVVQYLTPGEVTRKILNNNVLTTAYYAVKKQVSGL